MVDRRSLVGGAGVLFLTQFPVAAQPVKVPRIGVLLSVDLERTQAQLRDEWRQLGYVEGQNVLIDFRLIPQDQVDRLPEVAADLVRLNVDVIVAQFTAAAQAAKAATTVIPIVMAAVGDPVGTGLVSSLARPGGNVTGSAAFAAEAAGKGLQILKEILLLRHVAVLVSSVDRFAKPFIEQIKLAGAALDIDVLPITIGGAQDLEAAFVRMSKDRIDAVLVQPILPTARAAALALRHQLPAVSVPRWFAEQGGLLSYGPQFADLYRQAAIYVDRILKGAKPGDLPVVQATKFELVINMKTAEALGLKIPPSLLMRAETVVS